MRAADLVVGRAKKESLGESLFPFRKLVLPLAGNASRWAACPGYQL
jgi:hypothetical protein